MVQRGSERGRDEVCGGRKRTEGWKPQLIMCGDFVFGACAPKTVVLAAPSAAAADETEKEEGRTSGSVEGVGKA